MELHVALHILEINDLSCITIENVKKKYHRLALQNHPDKNGNTISSKETFQRINEAYQVVTREISIINNNDPLYSSTNTADESETQFESEYTKILSSFVDEFIKGNYNVYISSIIQDIVSGCKDISLSLFENMNKNQSLSIYHFIIKYKFILHVNDETIEEVKKILLDKFKDMQIYSLNPGLHDLFQNNVYKLDIDGDIYFVPLWHNELYFDSDIVVKCIPELPDHITIDEDNNLTITERISFTFSLLHQKSYKVKVGELFYEIPLDRLFIRPFQSYIFERQGISKIIEHDIYNIEEKADIIINIIFE